MTTSQQPNQRPGAQRPAHQPQYSQVPPQWYPPRQQWTPPPTAPAPKNGLGIAALVLGIVGALFSFIPIIGVIAWPLVILGLIFGIIGVARGRAGTATNGGVAIAGTILSLIGLIVCIVYAIAFTSAVSALPPAPASVPSASVPASGPSGAATTGKPGDTLTAGDMQITAAVLRSESGSFTGPMKCADVTYRNTGSVQAPFNMFDWTLQSPSGAITDPTIGGDNTLSSGELAPGGTTSGQVCFDAKSGQTGAYTLTYAGGFLGGEKVSWTN